MKRKKEVMKKAKKNNSQMHKRESVIKIGKTKDRTTFRKEKKRKERKKEGKQKEKKKDRMKEMMKERQKEAKRKKQEKKEEIYVFNVCPCFSFGCAYE